MSELLLAIDPGANESAYILWDSQTIGSHGKLDNQALLDAIICGIPDFDVLVIEKIASYGMAVGAEVFETVFWTGRLCEAAHERGKPVHRLPRMDVKMHLCGSSRAKDTNIRQALIDKFGAPGTKASPGALYGIKSDEWSALGVACTFTDLRKRGEI